MVNMYIKEKGMIKDIYSIKNPGKKSIRAIVEVFKNTIKKGKLIDLEFIDVEEREREVWIIAKELAELKVLYSNLEKSNNILAQRFLGKEILRLKCLYPIAFTGNFNRNEKKDKCTVNVLEDGRMEVFDGEKVETLKISEKNGIKRR